MARGSVNKVILIGTLGRDPEVRYMPNGGAVTNLTLATDEGYNDRATGQKVEKTEWHRVVAYARLAEIMGEYLKKGAKVYIEGKLQTREWEKDGVKRYTTEIVANEMTMLDGRNQNAGQDMGGYQQQPAMAPQAQVMPQQNNYQPAQQPMRAPQQPVAQPAYGAAPQQNYAQPIQRPQAPKPAAQPMNAFDDFDDDIPF